MEATTRSLESKKCKLWDTSYTKSIDGRCKRKYLTTENKIQAYMIAPGDK